ncbi:Short-chain dehydrogenase [Streptomyces sp. LamerLS-316]|uniref:oxidoreductase n=1 Tax=unclassified Streptomyces TaxID=2593676 RepID=UPI000823E0F0|nr:MULTISPECIES: oxidoreductase [unclassified Streptomyces]MYQ41056.1 SDR family NAD(P)-dependent oxidoreductase [Streptomyces sp. SID4921]SCK07519.1 Short-chain dehydrogenase [Streptomyces sp. LamerLS-316]
MIHPARIFLITGVSSGLGRAFATAALDAGHTVVGTVRKEADATAFTALHPERAHVRILDVTDDAEVFAAVGEVEQSVGPIDVLIANAGYGLEGTFEETPLADVRAQFDVNVFGAAATVQAVLPSMRARRRGHILAVTSMGGLAGFPGVSAYCGSKYALEGILEAVGKEVAGFGIHVTAVEPGSFRTEWAGRSMARTPRSIPDYDELFEPIRTARQRASGHQLGDPAKAAAALLRIIDAPDPPAHLVLGSDALRLIRAGREAVDRDLDTWQDLTLSTDFTSADDAP